jgi:hypothetical protein
MEFRVTDMQNSCLCVYVAKQETRELPYPQPSRVKQHDGDVQHCRAQGRIGYGRQIARNAEHVSDLLWADQNRSNVRLSAREIQRIWNEAHRHTSLPVETESPQYEQVLAAGIR